ncbi:MAG: hypothetical protein UX10_C0001G0046 [Candidatus Magasanikbacteria bacterium GW2011_GWA2_45_39]|uniref:Glycosyltransferase RgtA/B/C/D-like domain-containing protein n=2 Tax=Candidatus Magasanikiibacteriota TaxID=1752731 RepID=A0A0G1MWQ3_9BACT|nr:MAG: hypothetical protein UX10_C0001G0046 [Candidatus Magasanikbacteria bacterium GW2011_GWA2_45_39]KKU12659.1 MAG: hypothetical protein UX20_C0046G0002 [Candidatus Magasanikbacteria bacterium GW2011_GWC2_45_8]
MYSKTTPSKCILLFLIILIVYLFSSNLTSGDSKWTLFSATSIIKERNTTLDEYHLLFKETDFRIEKINGHYYNIFPIGPTLLSVPFVWSADALTGNAWFQSVFETVKHKQASTDLVLHYYTRMEMYIASVITALSALFLFLWLARITEPKTSALLTLIYAFGTGAWSTASRALWQHGPSLLFITLTLYLIERARTRPRLLMGAGTALALTYLMRPTNSLVIIGLTVYVLYAFRHTAWQFFAGAAPVALAFFIYNFSKYGTLLPAYYLPTRLGTNAHFFEALAGNIVSPARGIFIFSPILLFSLFGVYIKYKEKKWNAFDTACAGIIIAHWLSISSFIHWWGGHSYGSRFFTDMMPFFIYFLVPAIAYISAAHARKKIILTTLFSAALMTSFFIHGVGANIWSAVLWNATPVSVDEAPARLWDWRDLQFLRW